MLVTTAEATEPIDKVRVTLLQVTDQFSLTGPSSWNKCYSAWFTWSYNFEKSKPDKSDQEFNKRLSTKLSKNKCLIQPEAGWNFHLPTITRHLWAADNRRSFNGVNRHSMKRSKQFLSAVKPYFRPLVAVDFSQIKNSLKWAGCSSRSHPSLGRAASRSWFLSLAVVRSLSRKKIAVA